EADPTADPLQSTARTGVFVVAEQHCSGRRSLQTDREAHGRGLARTGFSNDPERGALRKREVDVFDRNPRPEPLRHSVEREDGLAHRIGTASRPSGWWHAT